MLVYGLLIVAFVIAYYGLPQRYKDSPWTWCILFGSFAVISLTLLSPKYSQLQGQRETRFLNRDTALEWTGEEISSPEAIEAARLQQPAGQKELQVPLRPLYIAAGVLVAIGLAGLSFIQLRRR